MSTPCGVLYSTFRICFVVYFCFLLIAAQIEEHWDVAGCHFLCLLFGGVTGLRVWPDALHRTERLNALCGGHGAVFYSLFPRFLPAVNVFFNYEFLY